MKRFRAGYSLFELIILVAVLGVVCYFIFLNQSSFSGERPEEMEQVAVEMIRMGLHNYAMESNRINRRPVYPLRLDKAEPGDVASNRTPLFTTLFKEGVRSGWKKIQENQYVFTPGTNGEIVPSRIYHYDPTRGTFEKGKPPGGSKVA